MLRRNHHSVVRYVVISQLIFAVMIVVCGLLRPNVIRYNGAFSSFGTQWPSAPVFVLGIVAEAAMLLRAAAKLPKTPNVNYWLSRLFATIALLLICIAATPFGVNRAFYVIHGLLGICLVTVILVASVWLITCTWLDVYNLGLLGVELAALVLGMLSTSEAGVIHLLAIAQTLMIGAFSLLLIRSVSITEQETVVDSLQKI